MSDFKKQNELLLTCLKWPLPLRDRDDRGHACPLTSSFSLILIVPISMGSFQLEISCHWMMIGLMVSTGILLDDWSYGLNWYYFVPLFFWSRLVLFLISGLMVSTGIQLND
ncbi:hypothetical protein CEXT_756331 [Caerostris extrusa]|uniref:Uncharacterized protein n=1 Tax=Caerostris extrusa TaxID=172846 RepID=A0AAV4QP78_CAEEX|nr:hypothetical protein CEXT_756331 [Caerostris extrusa]